MKIFVHNLKDYRSAEDYCDKMSESTQRQPGERSLLTTLLGVYLDKSLRCVLKHFILNFQGPNFNKDNFKRRSSADKTKIIQGVKGLVLFG